MLQLFENFLGHNLSIKYLKNSKFLIKEFDLAELKIYLFNEFWLSYQLKINELAVYGDGICENLERSTIL